MLPVAAADSLFEGPELRKLLKPARSIYMENETGRSTSTRGYVDRVRSHRE